MNDRLKLRILLGIIILSGISFPAFSQVSISVAQLNGTVRDEGAAVIVNASITLRELETNRVYPASANETGFYVIPNLAPGRYELKIAAPGFSSYVRSGIVLNVGQTATIDVALKVGSQQEQIQITDETPPIEPTRTEISQVIDTKQIASLPISGRLFTDFALLTPGVSTGRTSLGTTFTEFEVTRISFGGMRDFSNMVTVDGADNINTATGSQRSAPPQEAVSEFRVVNNSFGSDYGRALGGIVNIVTKSGTNRLHGSVYDYLQNDAVNARSLLQPEPRADTLRQNQFGAALGGPLRKDRTFFFVNYEGQRRAEAPTYPAELLNNLATFNAAKLALGLAPENLEILKRKAHDYGFARVDHELNQSHRLMLRYHIEDARDPNQLIGNTLDGGGIGAPSGGRNLFIRDQSLVGSVATIINAGLVNTALVQYARRHYDFIGTTGEPNLDLPNTLEFGNNFGVFDQIHESRVQFSDTLTWVRGAHNSRFGTDLNHVRNFINYPGFTPVRVILPFPNCLVDFANFVNIRNSPTPVPQMPGPSCSPALDPSLNGTPVVFWGVGFPQGPIAPGSVPATSPVPTTWRTPYRPDRAELFHYRLNHSYYGFFGQDQWRIRPKLTFNYGLRYDFETGLSDLIDPSYRGLQPRIGLAYSPDGKTVIRAGFGKFDDRHSLTFFFINGFQRNVQIPGVDYPGSSKSTGTWILNQLTPGPWSATTGLPAEVARQILTTGQYPGQYLTGSCPPSCTAGGGGIDRHARIPYSLQASLQVDREVGKGMNVSVGYLFVGAHKLIRGNNLNVPCPDGMASTFGSNGLIAGCSGTPDLVFGKLHYGGPLFSNAGLIDYNNYVANAAYHGLAVQLAERLGRHLTLNANYTFSKTMDDGTFTTFISLPQDQYNLSLERALSNQHLRHRFSGNFVASGPNRGLLRQFQLSGIVTLQSGRPFTLFAGFDANNDTNPVTDRVGPVARNTYLGDHLYSTELRLSRYFKLKEGVRLEMAVDSFNLFNRPNVDEVTTVYGLPVFAGSVPQRYKDGVTSPGNPSFGMPRTMLNPRQFQLSAKLSF
ncbi:MAG TPA: TonB-dependent receptor [Blastocatellia bacterium]|nr:TonB-dependent receptor [Blastocatellia bacterium]